MSVRGIRNSWDVLWKRVWQSPLMSAKFSVEMGLQAQTIKRKLGSAQVVAPGVRLELISFDSAIMLICAGNVPEQLPLQLQDEWCRCSLLNRRCR